MTALTPEWQWPSFWNVGWWLRWIGRDPGDVFNPAWVKSMGMPPREEWK